MTVAAPSSATIALRDRIREAAAAATPLRIVGGGTWLDAGRPVRAADRISMRPFEGIVEYVPGDLTMTVRAGTTLGEIREATAKNAQWLALDPPGSDDGTIGATVATASSGPLSSAFGAPRDLALGLEFVTATGAIVRGGGRVVKNVAGFDLTRLVTGSWGTLGAITEVTMRLHARPAADETVVVSLDDGDAGVGRVRQLIRRLPFTAYACEILNEPMARAIGVGDGPAMLMRMGGNAESVRAQRESLRELGAPRVADPDAWARLCAVEPPDAAVLRLSQAPSRLDATWREAMALVASCPGTLVHARPARGIVRCIVPRSALEMLPRALAATSTSARIGERLPEPVWSICAPAPANDPLSRGVKSAFDPARVLNPGILGELA